MIPLIRFTLLLPFLFTVIMRQGLSSHCDKGLRQWAFSSN